MNLTEKYEIDDLELLHCDIDQGETYMLDGAVKSLTDKKIDNLFIMTHAKDANEAAQSSSKATKLHEEVRSRLLDFGYTLVFDHETCDQSGDAMVIFKRKNNEN